MKQLSNKHIAQYNIIPRLPVTTAIAVALFLDRIHAPGLAWGVYVTVFSFWMIGVLMIWFNNESVDLFAEPNKTNKENNQ